MTPEEYTQVFDIDFLKSLSEWQKGWGEVQEKRRLLADKLVSTCEKLPDEFKTCEDYCFRKRFIVGGEIVPIILNDDFFEGIASWSLDLSFTKTFKYLLRPDSKFAMIFKKRPRVEDVIVNVDSLWKNKQFKVAVQELEKAKPKIAKPIIHFKNYNQSEVVLRTTLKGSEIEHIVGVSSSFEDICDMGNIPEEEREELSIRYAKDPNGIPISFPTYASFNGTRMAVERTINKMRELINEARQNDVPIYNLVYEPHADDLKHKIK